MNVQVKAIGVSNFTVDQIQGIIDATGVVPVRPRVFEFCAGAYLVTGGQPNRSAPSPSARQARGILCEEKHPPDCLQSPRQQLWVSFFSMAHSVLMHVSSGGDSHVDGAPGRAVRGERPRCDAC